MTDPYDLLSLTLSMIEDRINEKLSISKLSGFLGISDIHLQRLFKFAFGMPLASYIRSRKLASSSLMLTTTSFNIIDIANEYDFSHEQTYIRAFKREYGITPGELRKSGKIITVIPPLALFDKNRLPNGTIFGPDIVMVPELHLRGKQYSVPFDDSIVLPPRLAKSFWQEQKQKLLHHIIEPNVYYGLTRIHDLNDGYSSYMPSVRVEKLSKVPNGFIADVFPACLCLKFHYIGQHHYNDINVEIARSMYNAIVDFENIAGNKYISMYKKLYFERIDTSSYDGTYCQMEWYTPIYEKQTLK